jgi:outer membrane receptor protein involved in Fe transport
VGLLIDGVDFSGVGTAATLFDVSQIEVLRGPQGTLYGANALAGLINVVTPASTIDWQSRAQFDLGNYGAQGVGAVISGPLNDTVGVRLVHASIEMMASSTTYSYRARVRTITTNPLFD